MHRALALVPSDRGPRWLSFRDPVEVHAAATLDEVPSVVAAAEHAAAAGRWVVLVLAYDAAPAFEPAMVAQRHRRAPLAVAGVFTRGDPVAGPRRGTHRVGPWRATWDAPAHAAAVSRVRDRIAAGDVYQVNLTLRLRAEFEGDAEALFTDLFRSQVPAQAMYVELEDGAVCSASPEVFLARDGDRVTTRPMKGTARRHPGLREDREAVAALRASPKERAENTMIVDVARNDLGRVGRTGSVAVDHLHTVEHYPTVHQLTSTVRADTDAGLGAVLGAVFPAASITGAPKVRATQVIAELESSPRGIYCGTVGVLGPERWQLGVAIRTAWVDREEGTVEYGVGGGIVWDSDPAAEWAEVAAKSAILRTGSTPYELLETMRWEPSTGLLAVGRHRDRLLASGRFLGFDVDPAQLDAVLASRSVSGGQAGGARGGGADGETAVAQRVRLLVDARGGCRVEATEAPPYGSRDRPAGPWRAALAPWPVRLDDLFCRHKTTHRAVYDHARAARPGVDEVICWNEAGLLTETTIGNLVLELDGRLVTPHQGAGLLPGTLRSALLEDGTVVEAEVAVAELCRATRLWTVNAVRGWVLLELAHRG